MEIRFWVPGEPKGKARARTFYNPRMGRMQSVTPESTMVYENLIRTCYRQAYDGRIADGIPVVVEITAFFDVPKSASKKRKAGMIGGEIMPTKKPDIDNIAKVILDAMNGLVYHDDTQVIGLTVNKLYGEEPGVMVCVRWEEEEHDAV